MSGSPEHDPAARTERSGARRLLSWLPADVRSLGIGSVAMFVALSIQNVSNLVFHVGISRIIGPSKYGELASLLSVAFVVAVPVTVVQTVAAKRVALLRAESHSTAEVLGRMMKTLFVAGLASMAALAAATPLLAAFLHISWRPTILIGPYFLAALLAGLAYGALQGNLRFTALGVAIVAGVLVRLTLGIALTASGLGVEGAMLATVAAQLFATILAMRLASLAPRHWRRAQLTLTPFRHDFWPALFALGSFAVIAQIDLVLARHYLLPESAGLYSGAGIVARAVLFLPGAVALVAFPRFAALHGAGKPALRWLNLSSLAVIAIVAAAVPFVAGLSEPLVVRVLGQSFRDAATLVPMLSVAMGAMALVSLLTYFHLAAETYAYRFILAGIAVMAGSVALMHSSPRQIATVVALSGLLVAFLLYQSARAASVWPRQRTVPRRTGLPHPDVDLSIVLPCHNAGHALHALLTRLSGDLLAPLSFEITVVSDGSTDDTVAIARSFGPRVKVIERTTREGKGSALRAGLESARGRYIAFMDSDGDISADDLKPFLTLMDLYTPDIILGSKRHPLSMVRYPTTRRLMSWVYHKLTRLLFRVNVSDTQTGLKMIRREVLVETLPRMLEKRFAFDLELLVVARRHGFSRVFEAPVRIDYRFESHIDPRETFRIVVDTLAIFYRRYLLGTYDSTQDDAESARVGPSAPQRGPVTRSAASEALAQRVLVLNWRDVRNPDAGGAEVYAHQLAGSLLDRGCFVEMWSSRFPGCSRMEEVDGVVVRRMGKLRSGSFHLSVFRELGRVGDFDLVIESINSVPFFTPLRRKKLPRLVAVTYQMAKEVWFAELPRPLAALGAWAEPHLLGLYRDTPMVTISESTRQDLAGLGIDATVIPVGHSPEPLRAEPEPSGAPTVLFVGRLARNKQPHHALEAFRMIQAEVPDARLTIVGRGPLEAELIRDLPRGASLMGFVPDDQRDALMAGADCVLVPSVREGWGLVVIEANAVGTPCVGYDVPGLRDSIVDGKTGVLVPPNDTVALAAAAIRLLRDHVVAEELGSAARKWADRFTWEEMARKWMSFLDDVHPDLIARTHDQDEAADSRSAVR